MGLLIPLAVCLAVVYIVLSAIYNLFFHPLANQPGPFLCRISGIPTFYYACKGDRHIWQWRMFETYGDRFRAAPNLLLFRSSEAYNCVFSPGTNVAKSPFYHVWRRNVHDLNTLHCTDLALHAQRRKALALAFTEQSVKATIPYTERHVDRWNELLPGEDFDAEGWSQDRDIAEWADYLNFDLFADVCFGAQNNIKEPGPNPLRQIPHAIVLYMKIHNPIARSPLRPLLLWLKPRGLDALLELASPKDVNDYYRFTAKIANSRIEEERHPDAEKSLVKREDMFHFLCTARDPDTGDFAISRDDLISDASLLIMAGSHSSSTTVAGLFFYITRNSNIYAKLVKEIVETFEDPNDIGSKPELLAKCEYLRATIFEAMRMSPAGVCEAERIVQKGGAVIAGVEVPEGITVGVPPWCHNRNEDTFGDANTFRPERWIVSTDPKTYNSQAEVNRLKRCFHPFTKGVGSCLGQKMAMIQLCIIVARTLWRYDVRKAPGNTLGEGHPSRGWGMHDPSSYQLRDAYVSLREGPIVQFKRRERYANSTMLA